MYVSVFSLWNEFFVLSIFLSTVTSGILMLSFIWVSFPRSDFSLEYFCFMVLAICTLGFFTYCVCWHFDVHYLHATFYPRLTPQSMISTFAFGNQKSKDLLRSSCSRWRMPGGSFGSLSFSTTYRKGISTDSLALNRIVGKSM